jgi:hypothetical protein
MVEFYAAVFGAIMGGIVTYFLKGLLEREKHRDAAGRLHSALITEIVGHHIDMRTEFDEMLPVWIRRGEPQYWEGDKPLTDLKIKKFTHYIYDEFRRELLYSDYVTILVSYYMDLFFLNKYTDDIRQGTDSNYRGRIVLLIRLFIQNIDLTNCLIAATPPKYLNQVAVASAVNAFKLFEKASRRLIAVATHTGSDIRRFYYIAETKGHEELPPPLNESKDWMRYIEWKR